MVLPTLIKSSIRDPVRIRILTPTRILYFRENSATKRVSHPPQQGSHIPKPILRRVLTPLCRQRRGEEREGGGVRYERFEATHSATITPQRRRGKHEAGWTQTEEESEPYQSAILEGGTKTVPSDPSRGSAPVSSAHSTLRHSSSDP